MARGEYIKLVEEPTDPEMQFLVSGIVFVCLYSCLLAVSSWRAYALYKLYRDYDHVEVKKTIVHVLVALFALFEIIYGISFVKYESPIWWGYCFHIFAIMFSTLAFCMIPLIWNKILAYGGTYVYVQGVIGFAILVNIVVAFVVFSYKAHVKDSTSEDYRRAVIAHAFSNTGTLMILSIWLFIYGGRIYWYLSHSNTAVSNSQLDKDRRKAIFRMLLIISLFSLCYFVRSVCVAIVGYETILNKDTYSRHFSLLGWYLCSQWIPFVIPAYLMLYVCMPSVAQIMQKKRSAVDNLGEEVGSPMSEMRSYNETIFPVDAKMFANPVLGPNYAEEVARELEEAEAAASGSGKGYYRETGASSVYDGEEYGRRSNANEHQQSRASDFIVQMDDEGMYNDDIVNDYTRDV